MGNTDPREAVRALFDAFIEAQNAHDQGAIADLIWDSPDFLWITRTRALSGRAAALAQFEKVYAGAYNLAPRMEELRFVALTSSAAQLFVPVELTIGAPGEEPATLPFMLHQSFVATPAGWRIASILPVQAQPAAPAPSAA